MGRIYSHNIFCFAKFQLAMSSPKFPEKNSTIPTVVEDKTGTNITDLNELQNPGKEHLHVVPRNDTLPRYDDSRDEGITGYNAELMAARVTMSSTEEKKLLWRIDWHLIPLLSLIYMVKTIDAANVCDVLTTRTLHDCSPLLLGFQCTNYG